MPDDKNQSKSPFDREKEFMSQFAPIEADPDQPFVETELDKAEVEAYEKERRTKLEKPAIIGFCLSVGCLLLFIEPIIGIILGCISIFLCRRGLDGNKRKLAIGGLVVACIGLGVSVVYLVSSYLAGIANQISFFMPVLVL